MASLKEVGEQQLIRNIRSIIRPAKDARGTDDDAVVLQTGGDIVASTDVVTFERHMPRTMSYERFGWMAAAVNFSDLAAMGARPIGLLTSLSMPPDMDEHDLYDIVSGMDQCAEFVNTFIVGGDTKPGTGSISCTALGTMEGREPMMRSGAEVGDIVAVTGPLGGPAAGFAALENNIDAEEAIFSLMVPVPMVDAGIALSSTGKVTSCIDLSDGLATAANTICKQSHVGMEIVFDFLPVAEDVEEVCNATGGSMKDMLIGWGGEYVLMFTFRKEDVSIIQDSGVMFSIIGHVTNDDGVYLLEGESERTRIGNGVY
ncbi:MAG: thiamine-phosphate kinase [Candidatus Methanomethylophilaceae archaeon]|nr:thiamine-phosphate kinase [Candidatus Methanomethylophilaceae archaeon]